MEVWKIILGISLITGAMTVAIVAYEYFKDNYKGQNDKKSKQKIYDYQRFWTQQ